jgi:HK97 family phage prohead protease/HK97 family phage major capsid protein
MKDKVLYLNSTFTKDLPTATEPIDSIYISGYANTTTVDRVGDIIPMTAWNKAMENYLKNPIILTQHDYDDPCGRMVDYRVDEKGLFVKARISAAAEDTFNLVKDGVLTAFSVGFTVKDAVYDAVTDLFIIKDLELLEISVVSIPCNQDSIFSLSKAFTDAEEYSSFKNQFATKGDSAKGLDSTLNEASNSNINKEWNNMDPKELEVLLAKTANEAADRVLAAQKAAEVEAKQKAAEQAEFDAKVKAAVESTVSVGQSGAERLLADIEKRFEEQTESTKSVLAGLESALKDKTEELAAIQKSKMQFGDKSSEEVSYDEKEKAFFLSKMTGKALGDTKFGQLLLQKQNQHLPSNTWELEVSTNLESEVRRRLVVAPIMRQIAMQTNVMTIPVNPEAGTATWIANTAFGTTTSAGATGTHTLKEITLNAYKLATLEYLNFEEEEDSLLVLTPIIRDSMVRRLARSVDKAYLIGGGGFPGTGLSSYVASGTATALTATATGALSNAVSTLRNLRKGLGAWGLDPAELVYIVSTEIYYDLLDDTSFQTMNQVGPQATLLTGQVGQIGNSPVLVSAEFASKAASAVGAIAVAPGNFLVGNQRGIRFDTQDMVETQRKALVASLRTGLTQISTNLGQGVTKLTWN